MHLMTVHCAYILGSCKIVVVPIEGICCRSLLVNVTVQDLKLIDVHSYVCYQLIMQLKLIYYHNHIGVL